MGTSSHASHKADSTPSRNRPTYYKVPVDRRWKNLLWATHILEKKSISRIVTEALATKYNLDPDELASQDTWQPRNPEDPS